MSLPWKQIEAEAEYHLGDDTRGGVTPIGCLTLEASRDSEGVTLFQREVGGDPREAETDLVRISNAGFARLVEFMALPLVEEG